MKIYGKYIRALSSTLLMLSLASFSANAQKEESAAKDWKKVYSSNSWITFDKGLMGLENGVYTSTGGSPGNTSNVMLRGINTIGLNSAPYVVVDGIVTKMARTSIGDFASGFLGSNIGFLNPLDIANIEVLHSGFGSVMYGGKAANGVINITTDKGKMGTTSIELLSRFGMQQANYDKLEMMGGEEYRAYIFDYMHNMGSTIVELEKMNIFDSEHAKYKHSTNWMDFVEKDAMFQDYQVKMSGGDGDTRYMFGLGYSSQEGTIDPTNFNRFSMRINLDYRISPKVSMSNYLSYSYGTSTFFDQGNNWAVHPLYVALTKAPFLSPLHYADNGVGTLNSADSDELGKSNPALFKNNLEQKGTENRIDAVIKTRWDMNEKTALNLALTIAYVNSIEDRKRLSHGIVADEYRLRQNAKRTYSDYIMNWNLWAERSGMFLTDGTWNGKLGLSVENEEEKSVYGSRVNASTDDFESLGHGDVDSIYNMDYRHNMLNFYAEGSARVLDRVSLNARVNAEASSNFGKTGRWGIYGGVGLGVDVLSLDDYDVNFLASWGRVGNHDIRGYYQHSLYYPTDYFGYGGVYFGNSANEDIKPEITNNYDLGVKARLFNTVDLYVGYYYKQTTGLLTTRATPIELGMGPQFENNGDAVNQGLEFSIHADVIRNDKFRWNVFANISTLTNEITSLANGEIVHAYDGFTSIAREGEELGAFYGYKIKGIYNTSEDVDLLRSDGTPYLPGDYKKEDSNPDGIINEDDMQVIGSPLPDFYGGFGTQLNYKGLELSMLFSYSYGNDVYNLFKQRLSSMADMGVPVAESSNRWTSEVNPGNGYLARSAFGDPSENFSSSDMWIEDGSYLKLKTLSVNYTIPLKNTSGFIKGMKIFANCNNLFTVTSYSGLDPDVYLSTSPMLRGVDTGGMPNPRSYVFGINLSL